MTSEQWARWFGGTSLEDYDKEVRRRVWRKRLAAVGEILGGILTLGLLALLAWLWMWATPPQMSAEYDWAAEQTRNFERGQDDR